MGNFPKINIKKFDYKFLVLSGKNYFKWHKSFVIQKTKQNVKIHLTQTNKDSSHGLEGESFVTIENQNKSSELKKRNKIKIFRYTLVRFSIE